MTNEELVKLIRDGNAEPVELWVQMSGLIKHIARKYKGIAEEEDLLQESYFGFLSALKMYNENDGISFAGYAAYWIRAAMYRYVEKSGRIIRLTANGNVMVWKLDKIVFEFQRDYNRLPTDAELCEALGVTGEQLSRIRDNTIIADVGSLDAPIGEDQEDTIADLLPGSEDVEGQVIKDQLAENLWEMIDEGLTKQQAETLRRKYKHDESQQEIASALGVTAQRVHSIEFDALRSLRKDKFRKVLEPYLDGVRYSKGIRRHGRWTSSTEKAALDIVEGRIF